MSILSEVLLQKLNRTFKQVFVSRNEFQVLENMLPETQENLQKLIDDVERKINQSLRKLDEIKKKAMEERELNDIKMQDFEFAIHKCVKIDRVMLLE